MKRGVWGRIGRGPGRAWLVGAVLSVVLVALALTVAVVGGDQGDGEGEASQPVAVQARIVSPDELAALEAELGHEVYWAGAPAGMRLELTEASDGAVYVRYFQPEQSRDSPSLTVGTYPVPDAEAATRRFAEEAGAEVFGRPGGGVVVPNPAAPGSVYLAYPGTDLQIEVFDPLPGQALALVRLGGIEPVGGR